MIRVLHIINRLAADGPTRGVIALAECHQNEDFEHRFVALSKTAYPGALFQAAKAGMKILRAPSAARLKEEIEWADIVELQFWNNPELYQRIRGDWPDARILLRCHMLGLFAPQVLTQRLLRFADACATSSIATLETLSADDRLVRNILSPSDMGRVESFSVDEQKRETFRIGYIGTVNFAKLHPSFVEICGRITLPDARFVMCGRPDPLVKAKIEASGDHRFELLDYVEDIGSVLAQLDLFGYPLSNEAYATSEKSLQEAMYVGVPPVVFDHPALRHLVKHEETGLVVSSAQEYAEAIEYLHRHPEERRRLGLAAREVARREFHPNRSAYGFAELYAEMMRAPKCSRTWSGVSAEAPGSEQFLESLGDLAPQFAQSYHSSGDGDEEILNCSTPLSGGEGGVMQYRNAFPEDPWLHYWAGLILLNQGRSSDALKEFGAAVHFGLTKERVASFQRVAALQSEEKQR